MRTNPRPGGVTQQQLIAAWAVPEGQAAQATDPEGEIHSRGGAMATTSERSRLMWLLRRSPAPLLAACVLGGVLMAVSAGMSDRKPREGSAPVVYSEGEAVRLGPAPGWVVKPRPQKNGSVRLDLFTPEGEFAFEVAREQWRSLEDFVSTSVKWGEAVEDRAGVAVARRAQPWSGLGGQFRRQDAVVVRYHSPGGLCLRFVMRDDRFEPDAFRLFRKAEVLPGDDPLAESTLPDPAAAWRKQLLWDAGTSILALGFVLFIAVLWGGVYLVVVEASRGMPGMRAAEEPAMAPEPSAAMEAIGRSLSGLGFRHEGWFSLDDFDETHVSAWRHGDRAAVAFVLNYPLSGWFRLRIVRRFDDGSVLVSSTRLNDVACAPPPGVYVQVRYKATVEELWGWHLEGEKLFPAAGGNWPEPKDLFIEVGGRWGRHKRSDPTWLLAVEPVEECWRMYRLNGMPVREQIERGWAPPIPP